MAASPKRPDVRPFLIEDREIPMSIAWRNAMRREYREARRRTRGPLGLVVARQAVDRLIASVTRVSR